MTNETTNGTDRARKRAIRARMAQTGETYVVAARHNDEEQALSVAARVAETITVRCSSCSGGVVVIGDVPIRCPACGTVWNSPKEAAEEYADRFLGLNWHTSIKDGGPPPAHDCPECGETAVVWDKFTTNGEPVALCFACEETWNDVCMRCGGPMQQDDGVCSTCWSDVLGRD